MRDGQCFHCFSNAAVESGSGSRAFPSQLRFQPRPEYLDWVQFGRIGREEDDARSRGSDGCLNGTDLVGCQIVHHDDVSLPEDWDEHLRDVGEEDVAVSGSVDSRERDHAGERHGAEHRDHASAIARHPVRDGSAARCSAMRACHGERGAGLIQEYQTSTVSVGLELAVPGSRFLDLCGFAFLGDEGFFLRV